MAILLAALAVYFSSGFAALLYQVVWQRTLVIFSGTDDPKLASFDVVLGKGGSGGGNALVHVHPLAEERFLITSGRIKVVFDGQAATCECSQPLLADSVAKLQKLRSAFFSRREQDNR